MPFVFAVHVTRHMRVFGGKLENVTLNKSNNNNNKQETERSLPKVAHMNPKS
jgi:hypothetical protein